MLSGPFATLILGDLGAEIIKIEHPGRGDLTRAVQPTLEGTDTTAYFASLNGGKKSVTLDLSTPPGTAAFERLASTADVIIENYRPNTMERWGLGYDALSAANPDLVYCSISGFASGTYRDLPAFDMVVQALSGSMSVTGTADGPPLRPGLPIGDICAGMYAVIGVLAALSARDEVGGQYVEAPMYGGLASWLTERAGYTFATDSPYPRTGTVHPTLAPYRTFQTADGWFAVAIGSEGSWQSFCDAIDRPDLRDDPRFASNTDRVANRETLQEILEPLFARNSADEWFARFRQHGVPGAPVRDTTEVFEDEHLLSAPYTTTETVGDTELTLVTVPLLFSSLRTDLNRTPPSLGEHTDAVLGSVLTPEELAGLGG
ncbi:CaiB/BaiF CoA transferase family protein [Halomarina ordinaria]|uniref:CaiB/BaiF CoA transferase family protein n=1 Tax=Halomarina ordinaria TaxID=3033939 RepID=A0ABD5UBY8_9EURY|nr:CoA transferase [Halomarina sp. PSRA2]